MDRDINEILKSQRRMMIDMEIQNTTLSDERLYSVFSKQIAQAKELLSHRGLSTLLIRFEKIIGDPASAAKVLNRFYNNMLNEAQELHINQLDIRTKLLFQRS